MFNRIKDLGFGQELQAREGRPATQEGRPTASDETVPPNARMIGISITPDGIGIVYAVPKEEDESAPICPDCGRRHF